LARQRQQQVLGADVAGIEPAGLLLGDGDGVPRALGEALEHQPRLLRRGRSFATPAGRPPCFLCTACRLTPSTSAICCHDQPWSRAFWTWSSSTVSSSSRSDTTACSPTSGSRLPVASANLEASLMFVNLD